MPDDWFPATAAGVYEMMQNVLAKIGTYQVALGLTAGQVTNIETLATNYIAVYEFVQSISATRLSVTEWRDLLFDGPDDGTGPQIGDAMPAAPVFDVLGALAATVGIIPQFKAIRRNLVTLSGYTKSIGEDLKIEKVSGSPAPEANPIPSLKITVAANGYKANIKASLQGHDAIQIEYKPNGGSWTVIKVLQKLPYDLVITPQTPGQPESGHFRAIFIKDNEPVGNYSPEYPVTIAA